MRKEEEISDIGLIGLSHKTASVEMRELFSLDDEKVSLILERSCAEGIDEIVCISTCNRVELYYASLNLHDSVEIIINILEDISSVTRKEIDGIIYKKYSKDAVLHLLTVTSSLDSMVVGENEILGQMKDAYRKSVQEKKIGSILNKLFHQAFNTAKRVRTETEISRNPLSVAYIATELAKSIFEDISKRNALLVGAGEMGELILKYFTKYNIKEITIANRSFHNAERISQDINRDAHVIPLEDIGDAACNVDIIISSVSSPGYIITYDMVKSAVKKRKNSPLFLIDIAVPRSIDSKIRKLNNVFLYNIDDLKSIADENLNSRLKEVELARQLIESDVEEFLKWYEGLLVVPIIVNIQNKFNDIRKNELLKYRRRKLKHFSDEDFQIIEELTAQIMTKTLHNPIMYIKSFQDKSNIERESIIEISKIFEGMFLQ